MTITPNTQREPLEAPLRGPFGGIQSELPLDAIETIGFADLRNIILRQGSAATRPGYAILTALPAPANEPIIGIVDFFNGLGNRIQAVLTPTRLLLWNGSGAGSWTQITGPALTGTASQLFSSAVVNAKLLFSQGVTPVQLWDGILGTYAIAAATAVPAFFMMELVEHLVVGYTFEGGFSFPQRIRWTGAGDPTDWTSFDSGVQDILNDLGPLTGLAKLYQTGFVFQNFGITQMWPTGVGLAPWDFVPMSSRPKGCIAPFSIAVYGDDLIAYVGKDNIYILNGSQSVPIGDAPMSGSRTRLGARKRIFAELAQANLRLVTGYVSSAINGNPYNAYWLNIPNGSTWMFNFDEQNWTRFVFDGKVPSVINTFAKQGVIRIEDLIGTIAAQTWSPATLLSVDAFDDVLIGFVDGTPGIFDFTQPCESAWSITSGEMKMGDNRHNKEITRFRLVYNDLFAGGQTFTITVKNENGFSQTQSLTLGTGSGVTLQWVTEFKISGMFLTWTINGNAQAQASFVEFTPIFNFGGEYANR